MLAKKSRTGSGSIRILASAVFLTIALSALAITSASAAPGPLPREQHGPGGLGGSGGSNLSGDQAMLGAIGKYITSVDKADTWTPAGRGAYRADISIMSSSTPIKFKTTFKAPGGADLAGMRAAGIKLVLTVRNSTSNKDLPLPDDGSMDAAFQTALGAMIDQLQPDYLVYGNEVNDGDKYTGTVSEFQHLMTLAHAVAAGRGVLDGGTALMGVVTAQATYEDILDAQGSVAAAAFKKAAKMAPFNQAQADEANAFIDASKAAGLDFFVWHSYFADASAILSIKSYVEKRFDGPSFINELGWRTGSSATGIAIVDALADSGLPIVLLYGSGEGPNGPDKLWNSSGNPTTEGLAVSAHLLGM